MNTNTMLLLQSLLIFLQMCNAAFDGLPQPWPVVAAAFVGAFQYYIQHSGNQMTPGGK